MSLEQECRDKLESLQYPRISFYSLYRDIPNMALEFEKRCLAGDVNFCDQLVAKDAEVVVEQEKKDIIERKIRKGAENSYVANAVLGYMIGHCDELELSEAQNTQLEEEFGAIKLLLGMGRVRTAKKLIRAISANSVITEEVKQHLLEIMKDVQEG